MSKPMRLPRRPEADRTTPNHKFKHLGDVRKSSGYGYYCVFSVTHLHNNNNVSIVMVVEDWNYDLNHTLQHTTPEEMLERGRALIALATSALPPKPDHPWNR